MIKKYIVILFLAFSGSVFAESYLCLPEAGAGVVYKNKDGFQSFEAKIYDVSSEKFVVTNVSGEWVVKRHSEKWEVLHKCRDQYRCETKEYFGEYFVRYEDTQFEVALSLPSRHEHATVVMRGFCTDI